LGLNRELKVRGMSSENSLNVHHGDDQFQLIAEDKLRKVKHVINVQLVIVEGEGVKIAEEGTSDVLGEEREVHGDSAGGGVAGCVRGKEALEVLAV
jgi:predicted RNA-binding protein